MNDYIENNQVRSLIFIGDTPQEVMSHAIKWLESTGDDGYKNSHYFLNMTLDHDSEIGYSLTLFCGSKSRQSNLDNRLKSS